MDFVFADSSESLWLAFNANAIVKFKTACQDIPLPPSANILCLGCGNGKKELQFLTQRFSEINLMICIDSDSSVIDELAQRLEESPSLNSKVIPICENMDKVTSEFLTKLQVNVICFFGYSYQPYNLLNILLYNQTYFDFLNNGGKILIEPAFSGWTSTIPGEQGRLIMPYHDQMFWYSSALDNVFRINIYNNFIFEIRECLLNPEMIQNLKDHFQNRTNGKINISSI